MGILNSINLGISLIVDTFKQFGRGKVWLVLFGYFLINWLILYAHYNSDSPLFHGIINAWVGLFGENRADAFSHYPTHLMMMPYYFGWAKLIAGFIFETTALTLAALFFTRSILNQRGSSLGAELRSFLPKVVGVWLLINGLFIVINIFLPQVAASIISESPRRQMLFDMVIMPGLYMFIMAVLFLTIPSVVVRGDSIWSALKRSLSSFARYPATFIVLALFVLSVPVLFSIVTGRPDIIVGKFRPELVYWILLGGIFTDIFVNFFWIGTSVKFLADEFDR